MNVKNKYFKLNKIELIIYFIYLLNIMGYFTTFDGLLHSDLPLPSKIEKLINGLSNTRRMARVIDGYGIEGEYYVDGTEEDDNIININIPPSTQPSLWCCWFYNIDKQNIEWNGFEKFYDYVHWMKYILEIIDNMTDCKFNGTIKWNGQNDDDFGEIQVINNEIIQHEKIKKALKTQTIREIWIKMRNKMLK